MISAEHTAYIIHPEHDAKQMAIRDSLLERDKALAAATERAEKAERERDALKKLVEEAMPYVRTNFPLACRHWLARAKEALK